jgi:transcriptional regulator with XRE-family HTH domain
MKTPIQKTKSGAVYPAVARTLAKLGTDISLARRTRRVSTTDFAQQMGVSRATLQRLEAGDAGCSINTLAAALNALGQLDLLGGLLDQSQDHIGLMLTRGTAPQRIRNRSTATGSCTPETNNLDEGIGW